MDAASEIYLQKLSKKISHTLNGNLTGIYLHGSAVLGGYDVHRSDLDVLVVVPRPITEGQRTELAETLREETLPCPAAGLELSIVTDAAAATVDVSAPAFELHMTTAPADSKVVDGRGHGGDPDLVLHFAVCRVHGRNLAGSTTGKPLEEVFGAVPQELVVAQLRDELSWAARDGPRHYAVLNASRAWMYAETGQLVSKVAGGEWTLRRIQGDDEMPHRDDNMVIVRAALAKQNGDAVDMDADDVQWYVEFVLRILN